MACTSINGPISQGCAGNVGGLTKLYIANSSDVASVTDGSPAGIIDTVTMSGGATFYEFELTPLTSNYTENFTANRESGAQFYSQVVTVRLNRREYAKRNQLALLASGNFKIIVKDANGLYWYLGQDSGLYLSKNEGGSGTKQEDGSSYLIELTAVGESSPAKEVLEAAVTAVI